MRVQLRSDGALVGSVPVTAAHLSVGRDPGCGLVVPHDRDDVSGRAVMITRCAVDAVEVEVVNRNGVWLVPAADDGSGRRRIESGWQLRARVGERLDLDPARPCP